MPIRFMSCTLLILSCIQVDAQNYVATSTEWVSSGTISLNTSNPQQWITNRSSSPGYFSAIQGGTYTNASDTFHVNGYVKKYGNEAFTFPVGSGTDLRALTISAPASSSDAYATAWMAGDPNSMTDPTDTGSGLHPTAPANIGGGIQSLAIIGQWDWQAISGTGAGLTVTVSIPDMTSFAVSGANLRLAGWNGTQWVNLSGSTGASGLTENSTLSGTMVAGITALNIGSASITLPVVLKVFDVKSQNCGATFYWKPENEADARSYELERSADRYTFQSFMVVKPSGTGSMYAQTTDQPAGTWYYRLKIQEVSGIVHYSAVKPLTITCGEASDIHITPNPANRASASRLIFTTPYRGAATIIITTQSGQTVLKKPISVNLSLNTVELPTQSLEPGMYYVRLLDSKGNALQQTVRFIKQ